MWAAGSTVKVLLLLSFIVSSVPIHAEPPEVRVMVAGDIMMHKPITDYGYDQSTQQYNFGPIFSEVSAIFKEADLVIGNLETPLAGKEEGYSGYPRFNGPKEMALALKNAGFDVLTTANNHALDRGEKGVIQTLNHLDEYGLLHTGTFRNQKEKEKALILNINGMKIGLIAYTYGTNGIPVPKGKDYLVHLLDTDGIKKEIAALKENKADYILAMIHYGTEYRRQPDEFQTRWTEALLDMGVDFVLGSHPHVVQPIQLFENPKSSDKGVIFSLGNFLSNQNGDWKDYGVILNFVLEKDLEQQKVILKEISVIPTYVHKTWKMGKKEFKIIPLEREYVKEKYQDQQVWENGRELFEFVMKDLNIE